MQSSNDKKFGNNNFISKPLNLIFHMVTLLFSFSTMCLLVITVNPSLYKVIRIVTLSISKFLSIFKDIHYKREKHFGLGAYREDQRAGDE